MDQSDNSERPPRRRTGEWIFYAFIAAWIVAIQVWLGPQVRDFGVDDAGSLRAIQSRPLVLPQNDPRDLDRRRAGEVRTQLLAPVRFPHPFRLWRFLAQSDVHPPVYFWLFQFWVWGFGNSALSWAIFSALQLVIAGGLLYRLARTELDRVSALLPSLGLALSLPILNQSQTLRHYLLTFILTCASLLLAYPAFRTDSAGPSKPAFHWLGLALALAAGLTTHYLFGLAVLGINLAVLPGLWRAPRPLQLRWLGSQFLAALLSAPSLWLLWTQFHQREKDLETMLPPVESIPAGTFSAYGSYFFTSSGWLTLPLGMVLLLSLMGYLTRRPSPLVRLHFGISLMALGLYPFLVWAGVFRLSYALMPRFFMVAAPVILLLPAIGTARLPRVWLRVLPVVVLPALMLLHALSYIGYLRQLEASPQPASLNRNRLFADFVSKNLDPEGVFLLETDREIWLCLCYYLPENQRVWYAPRGGLGLGLRRLPDSAWGPDRPGRILYAVSRSEGSEDPGVKANLEFLSRAYELLPQKFESKTWKIFFLKSRKG